MELFLRNLLLNENNELHNRSMHIRYTAPQKQDIGDKKQDIALSSYQQKQFEQLVSAFGKQQIFGRTDIMKVLGLTPSPASALIKKLLEANKILAVKGHGKGKYIINI